MPFHWRRNIGRVIILFTLLFTWNLPATTFALEKPPVPIIFVHGINSNANEAWGSFRDFLIANGWTFGGSPTFIPNLQITGIDGPGDFYTMNFSDYNIPDFRSQHLTLDRQGWELDAIIQAVLSVNSGKSQVILVGHSMGGLAARNYIQGLARIGTSPIFYRGNILQLITVGTPHQGTDLAAVCEKSDFCLFTGIDPTSVAVALLKTGSSALQDLNNVITNPLNKSIFYTSIIGNGTPLIIFGDDGDGIVSSVSQNMANLIGTTDLAHHSKTITIPNIKLPCNTIKDFLLQTHTCETNNELVQAEILDQIYSPKLVITSDLSIFPNAFFPSYAVGQTISAQFSITNKGAKPVTVAKLTVGGRDPNNEVADFPEKTCITLEPNVAYKYVGALTLTKAGIYRFFPAYQTPTITPMCPLPDGNWNTAIPAVSGIRQYTLNSPRNTSVENDTTPPNVSISSPVNGATVNGTFSVTAEATDNLGVSRVEFYFDNKLLGSDSSFPYSWPWNTTLYSNGSHTLDAKAYDGAGNQKTSSSITVTVNNTAVDTTPPTISSVIASTTSTTATVTWTTNEMSTTQVEYGPTTSYVFSTPLLTVLSTGHAAVISNLQTNTFYHYRVKSRDAAGNLAVSGDNTFFTSSAGNVAPSVTVGKPNGGENWQAGSVQTITWTTKTGISSVSLFYSTDSGLNWTAIPGATGIANNGSFQWTIPNAASSTARVAITAIDGGMTGSDMSDGNFTISASCTAPSTPQLWGIGTLSETGNYTVNWSAVAGASTYTLQEATNSAFTGAIEYPPASGTSKSISGKTTNVYYYRVKANNSCNGGSSSGWSNTEFIPVTINQPPSVPSNPSPAHTVTNVSRRPTLSWTGSDPDGPVDFALFFGTDPGNLSAIRGFDSGGAASSYNFPFDLDPGKTYYWYIKARDNKGLITTGPTWQFTTEYSFADLAPTGLTVTGTGTIAPNAQVTLNLTVRNQGTFTAPGAEVLFYLSGTNSGRDQKISNCCYSVPELTPGAQATVSATVTLTNLKAGQSYIVAYLSTEGHFIDGNLGNNILGQPINYLDGNAPVISSLVLQFGNFRTGGESTIAFTVSDDIGVTTLDFYYSYDNGANWNTIATGFVPGSNGVSGGYDWTIPADAPLTNQLKIKMVAWDTSGNRSEAIAGPYTIISGVAPTVTLLSPNGGEVWDLGSTQTIRWSVNAPNGIARMNVYLYWANTATHIADITSNTSGSVSWTVPNSSSFVTNTARVVIRVEDLNRNESEDASDGYFSIRDASAPPPAPWTMPEVITGVLSGETTGHFRPRIKADKNENVHMVYLANSPGAKIYYKKRIGSAWSPESLVYGPSSSAFFNFLEIAVDADNLPHVVWSEQPSQSAITDNNLSDIYYSSYDGSSWSVPVNISNTDGSQTVSFSPKIEVDSSNRIHLVWSDGYSFNPDLTRNGKSNIYYRKKDATGPWSPIVHLTNDFGSEPDIASDKGGNIYVVYKTLDTASADRIAFRKWDGSNWTAPQVVANVLGFLLDVESDSNSRLHLAWYDLTLGSPELSYSHYDGSLWSQPEKVRDSSGGVLPSLVVDSSNRPHLVWEDWSGSGKIYHSIRNSGGWTIPTPLSLSSQSVDQQSSASDISATDHIHVVWTSRFNNKTEVFYNHADVSLDTTVPAISLLSPVSGEALSVGVSHPITWLATDNVTVSSISLKYTTDNGTTFTTISDGLPNTGAYSWTVPNISSSTVEIFATAFDGGGNQATATSGLFNISDQTPPAVSVQSPNGGEFFEAGSVQTIRWSATDNVAVSSVDLSFSADGGSSWISIVSDGSNTGAFEWTVPHFISANNLVRVVASDAGGRIETDTSNAAFTIVSANVPPLAPFGPLPPNGEANVSTQSALSWNGGDPDTGDRVTYTVYFGTDNNPPVVSTSQPTAAYNPGALTALTTYYWKVVASDGKASATGPLWSFTTGSEPVMAPTNLKATAPSANRVDLSWSDAASNEMGYTVERKMGLNGSYAGITTLAANAMTYSDIGLNGASTYIYRVRAFNTSTASAYSNEAAATTANTPPNLPSAPSPADHVGGQPVNLTLAWSGEDPDTSDTLTYDVYFGTNSDPPLVSTGQSLTNYTPEPLSHQKFYYWRVVATDNHGHSSSGPVWSFVTQAEPAPNTPVGLSGTATPPKEISLRWTDSSNNEIGFKLERKTGPNGAYDQIALVPANTRNYTDSNLISDKTYSYRILAYNGSGPSGYSNEVSIYLSPTGLRGEYFTNSDFSTPAFTRIDPEINFDWAHGSPDPSMEPDTFSVRWSGKIRIDHDETYTFSTLTDEGVRLWIDGHLVINHWQIGAASNNGTMALISGLHDIKVEFFEETGEAFVHLSWSSPSTPNAIIPQDHFLPPEPAGRAPTLSWTGEAGYTADGIDPQAGNTTAAFTYRVTYTDADGDAPMSGYPRVHILKGGSEINGSPFAMTGAGGSPAEGTIYTHSATLPEGTDYTYYFDAKDATGLQAVTAPTSPTPTAPLDAPDVGDAPPLQGDLDGSGRVDGFDLGSLGLAFGSRPGDPNWNPGVDLNGDGVVDGSDLTLLGVNFGKTR